MSITSKAKLKAKQRALKLEVGSIKFYLHMMLCDYIDAKFDSAKTWLSYLRDSNEKCPKAFFKLDKYDLNRLKMISKALDNNQYISDFFYKPEENVIEQDDNQIEEEVKQEKDLYKLLIRNEHLIKKVTGIDLKIVGMYQETEYGIIDLIGYSKVYAIPIEVKLNQANHTIVSQITKYMKSYMKRVNYMLYRDVLGITIARSYSLNAQEELKKINVIPLVYSASNNTLKITRLR